VKVNATGTAKTLILVQLQDFFFLSPSAFWSHVLPFCVTMPFDDAFLEHIKRRSAELAAIRKKESRKRKNQRYQEKNKSSIAQSSVKCKRSKKDSVGWSMISMCSELR
jgi:hypothetical protein